MKAVSGVHEVFELLRELSEMAQYDAREIYGYDDTKEEAFRKRMEEYMRQYSELIFGEGNEGKYWFVIVGNKVETAQIQMHWCYRCIPQVYQIKDANVWWIPALNYGKTMEELYETYDEAAEALKKKISDEIVALSEKIQRIAKNQIEMRKQK